MTTLYSGFTEHEESIVRAARERCPILFGAAGLTIQRARLYPEALADVQTSITGRTIVRLDLDSVKLPEDVIGYIVAHELAHASVDAYGLMQGARKQLSATDVKAVEAYLELAADRQVEDWGLGYLLSAWYRVFPTDERRDPAWSVGVEREFDSVYRRLAKRLGEPLIV